MSDPETLFLVNYHKAHVLEPDVLLNEAVRAYADVNASVRQRLNDVPLFASGPEPAQNLDVDRICAHPLGEGHVMLLRQNRSRGKNRDLLAFHDCLERRPEGDLGLAVADVAADQPVHGAFVFHITLDLGKRG